MNYKFYKENNFLITCLSEPRLVPLRESAINILNLLKQQLIFQFLSNNIVLERDQDFRVFRSRQPTRSVTKHLVLWKSARVASELDQGSRLRYSREKHNVSSFSIFKLFNFLNLDSPPPGSYEISSDFNVGRPGTTTSTSKNHIYSFGIGR